MDITKSLTFYLNDTRRVEKLNIGVALILISMILSPVLVGFLGYLILAGYCIRLVQNVRNGDPHRFPSGTSGAGLAARLQVRGGAAGLRCPSSSSGFPAVGAALMDGGFAAQHLWGFNLPAGNVHDPSLRGLPGVGDARNYNRLLRAMRRFIAHST